MMKTKRVQNGSNHHWASPELAVVATVVVVVIGSAVVTAVLAETDSLLELARRK